MLKQISPQALAAMDMLARQPRWRDVEAMLSAEVAGWTDRLLNAGDPRAIGEAQGYIKAYNNLLTAVRDAPATMEKLGLRTPL